MKKIIIFGGAFNPIHNMHINVALKAIKKINADKVFFIPSGNPVQKDNLFFDSEHCLNMVEIAIREYDFFDVCDFEVKRESKSFTIDTINHFQNTFTDAELFLLIGDDQLINFHSWKDYEKILTKVKIISYKRSLIRPNVSFDYIKLGFIKNDINSSTLRLKPNKKHLNPLVLDYINKKGVYAIERLHNNVSEYRFNHSLRVKDIALEICMSLKISELLDRCYVAAIYHDYCKEMNRESLEKIAKKINIRNYVSYKVLHAPVAAFVIKRDFFVNDKNILDAIANHVIPQDESTLTKIIYCADKLDIRKDWTIPNRDNLLKLAKTNLHKAFIEIKTIVESIESKKIC
ncbi:MAG: nicotinate (nicotinamide) nucleotide adenylyltransferase [Malacoplasma sp.]